MVGRRVEAVDKVNLKNWALAIARDICLYFRSLTINYVSTAFVLEVCQMINSQAIDAVIRLLNIISFNF